MGTAAIRLLASSFVALSAHVVAAGLPPWQFGMSKQDVVGFSEFGPYKEFKNGDVETFNGLWDGKKENIQFFFDESGLHRIGIYLYEGQKLSEARTRWRTAYESLKKKFGDIEVPGIKYETGLSTEEAKLVSLANAAAANADSLGKTQMAPVKQPDGMFIFSSFIRKDLQGGRFYYVIVYFDRHH